MKTKTNESFIIRFLNALERKANKLPHPNILFVYLFVIFSLLSILGNSMGWSVSYLYKGKTMVASVENFWTQKGVLWWFSNIVKLFQNFYALPLVMFISLGIGTMDEAGVFNAMIKKIASSTPNWLVPYSLAFIGIMSNITSTAGYVILPPLAALLYKNTGRHPLAGLALAFAGVSAGWTANLFITSADAMYAGTVASFGAEITSITQNYYFVFVSTFVLTFVCGQISQRVIEPALGEYKPSGFIKPKKIEGLSPSEKRGAKFGWIAFAVFVALSIYAARPGGFMNTEGNFIKSFYLRNTLQMVFFLFMFVGIAFGYGSGKFKSSRDVSNAWQHGIITAAPFITMSFFASQFAGLFKYTKFDKFFAGSGANILKAMNLQGKSGALIILLAFILIVSFVNVFIASASGKWFIVSPVFIPMFVSLGLSTPAVIMAYRIADSTTNIITPLNPFLPIVIATAQMYKKDSGLGTVLKLMLPYSFFMLAAWTIMFALWFMLGIPFGVY